MTKLAVTVEEASTLSGLSRTTLYSLINSGKLIRRKSGARTLILIEDLETCLRSLPADPVKEAA